MAAAGIIRVEFFAFFFPYLKVVWERISLAGNVDSRF